MPPCVLVHVEHVCLDFSRAPEQRPVISSWVNTEIESRTWLSDSEENNVSGNYNQKRNLLPENHSTKVEKKENDCSVARTLNQDGDTDHR